MVSHILIFERERERERERESKSCFLFSGCYFHGHKCPVTEKIKDPQWITKKQPMRLESLSYEVVTLWESEWRKMKTQDEALKNFLSTRKWPSCFKGIPSQQDILTAVEEGKFFGAVEVNITVPEKQWVPRMRKNKEFWANFEHRTPEDLYAGLPPLFLNTDIPVESMGDHMQAYMKEAGMDMKRPRRLLVSGLKVEKVLLSSPLLRWYLEHGLEVTWVYQCIEYQKQNCFAPFEQEVANARRNAALVSGDGASIQADTYKLLWYVFFLSPNPYVVDTELYIYIYIYFIAVPNSGYGGMILDKTKHSWVKYIKGEHQAKLCMNDKMFRDVSALDNGTFEVQMAKNQITLDLPIQIGFFILQYAKLRMLQFFYDFMLVFVDQSDFQLTEMDTDSLCMAISGESLNEVVKEDREPKLQDAINNKEKCGLDVVYELDCVTHFLPRICCERHKIYDQKTPGLFKLEFDCHVMISDNLKCMPPKTGRQARKSRVQKVSGNSTCKIGARLPAGRRVRGHPRVLDVIFSVFRTEQESRERQLSTRTCLLGSTLQECLV